MKLHLVQMHPELGDNAANLERIEQHVARGLERGADLIAFGECALNGYDLRGGVDYQTLAETVPGPATVRIVELLAGSRALVLLGMAERDGPDLYNSAPLIGASGIIGVARKLYPMRFTTKSGRNYDEKLVFRPGQRIAVFDTEFGRIGVQICMDNVHPEISYAQAIAGCWLRLRPSAGPSRPGQPDVSNLDLVRAVENQTCDCYINIVGDQGGVYCRGGTSVILGGRGLQTQLSVGGDATEGVLEYEINPEDVLAARGGWRHIDEVRPGLLKQLWDISMERSGEDRARKENS